ncbi:MAG: glycoside hydrolase family 2 [Porphyrobacter sp.]|nr:glycoside hydrolase family 2 [Porphyrobacter sp.]
MVWLHRAFACLLAVSVLAFAGVASRAPAQTVPGARILAGPVNAVFPPAGNAIRKDLAAPLDLQARWTVRGWIKRGSRSAAHRSVMALVDAQGRSLVAIALEGPRIVAEAGDLRIAAPDGNGDEEWLMVTLAAEAGKLSLQVGEGRPVTGGAAFAGPATALVMAPRELGTAAFDGAVANLAIWLGDPPAMPNPAGAAPDERLIQFETGSPSWPLQIKQTMGLTAPQDPATLPVSRAAPPTQPRPAAAEPTAPLTAEGEGRWEVGAWRLAAAPDVRDDPATLSHPGFDTREWLPAVVPGTILATYVANGVYPDPAFGLNNLLIPESLSRQDYWLRTEFTRPESGARALQALTFLGINYAAEVWVNGERLGETEGAFIRGRFVLPARFRTGAKIAVAVRISPPPHPGLPQEESLSAGPGQNGGAMMIDGPTFGASEGWDWIPSVRDRNTGLWQAVVLEATGAVRLGDPQVRTVLPEPDNSLAELTFAVPVTNDAAAARAVEVEARFGEAVLRQTVNLLPGATTLVRFTPADFPDLRIRNPRLWWPNGYGEPTLHDLTLTARVAGAVSDSRSLRFGIREISYELSALDAREELRRIALAPARGDGAPLLDVTHEGIRKIEGGWAVSLARDIAASPALAQLPETTLAPHLLIRVNGVPIAVRGGNWGMDDWMKRVSRERMEPFFRLHREAHVNTIRNWMGQSTEEVFYQLADEYGLLVLNDFWMSTQDHNGEPGDSALFLANAADTISRFQSHPSIALWIGRNEGVPPPVLNAGLEKLVRERDGTRAYLPNSREVNMANSGPWNYQPAEAYFTRIGRGFSTEVGTPSFPTLETFKTMMPPEDQWPVSDSWAYHDWHQAKAGDVASFMKAMTNRYGAPVDLADFETKAQALNYESHRAIFEGMNAGLFTRNSGRLLWMTQPAWPSTTWQIYSHDYDTHAAFFGAKKGAEPVHVQIDLPERTAAVVNSLGVPISGGRLRIRSFALDGTLLGDRSRAVDAAAYAVTDAGPAVPEDAFAATPVVIVKLELFDAADRLLSENLYWLAREASDYRAMGAMPPARVAVRAERVADPQENVLAVQLTNTTAHPALMVKLTLTDAAGARVLPAYFEDNYVSLLPGETRSVTIRSPRSAPVPASIGVRGWNVEADASRVMP